uniref:hexokinase n=1 Tax=Anas platyrhynchos platyrhynchos TaxID=8840 RepID=A0A493TFR3_ANAPP
QGSEHREVCPLGGCGRSMGSSWGTVTLQVLCRMLEAMEKGLSQEAHAQSTVHMLPTFICSTPDGTEKGDLMVVELCQSHVRTLFVTLLGDGNQSPQLMYKTFEGAAAHPLPLQLFDFVAQCVQKFLEEIGNPQHRLPVGFVFPFSCRQTGLGKVSGAELISWSKGFQCSDVEGKDVVQLLQAAINKLELYHVEVIALLNDTVGTMMASSWGGKPCEIALVMGTGTNSCFMAEAQLVEVVEENNGRMCVNSEWGCFGDDGALNDVLTPYDHRVDQESSNPGERRFEKMVGGLYLGEIVRHAMLMLAAEQALFIGASTSTLGSKDAFKTQQVLEIMDNETGMAKARSALEALGLQPSERDCCRVQQICRAVVSRAAALSAMGLAAILSLMCRSRELERLVVNVGVDGELYRAHILQSVTGLLAPECAATLVPAADTNGLGVAMVTAVAQRMLTQRHEVEQLLAPLRLSRADLERVQGLMRQEMERGLGRDSNADASVRMLPTYVCNTPDGTERGDFLALDLGGTNFRVLVVRVMEEGIHMASEIYGPQAVMGQGSSRDGSCPVSLPPTRAAAERCSPGPSAPCCPRICSCPSLRAPGAQQGPETALHGCRQGPLPGHLGSPVLHLCLTSLGKGCCAMLCRAGLEKHPEHRGPAPPCLCRAAAVQVAGIGRAAAGCELPAKRAAAAGELLHRTAPSQRWHRRPPRLPIFPSAYPARGAPTVPPPSVCGSPWGQPRSLPGWVLVPTAPCIQGALHPRGLPPR